MRGMAGLVKKYGEDTTRQMLQSLRVKKTTRYALGNQSRVPDFGPPIQDASAAFEDANYDALVHEFPSY